MSLSDRILALLQWPLGLTLLVASAAAWFSNLLLSKRWNQSRTKLMATQLAKLRDIIVIGVFFWAATEGVRMLGGPEWLQGSLGLLGLVSWLTATLRVGRVFVFEWLFAHSTHEGVPVLLVDLFTLAASMVAFGALVHSVFLIEVTSLVATSAVASVVLGLALQDTLGHLFAGISLQLDRPFRLGDWVEVRNGAERISGQVLEVSWRATLLLAIGEELVTIPNKTVAQGVVLNFSGRERPFVRSHLFRVPLTAPLEVVKAVLIQAALETKGVVAEPAPVPLIIETTESWVAVKMINFVTSYGTQYTVGDAYQTRALELLAARGIALASARLLVETHPQALAG